MNEERSKGISVVNIQHAKYNQAAVTWLVYFQHGVKHITINQSLYNQNSQDDASFGFKIFFSTLKFLKLNFSK